MTPGECYNLDKWEKAEKSISDEENNISKHKWFWKALTGCECMWEWGAWDKSWQRTRIWPGEVSLCLSLTFEGIL